MACQALYLHSQRLTVSEGADVPVHTGIQFASWPLRHLLPGKLDAPILRRFDDRSLIAEDLEHFQIHQ